MAEEEGLWVVLVGPHCAGKTTIGQELASRLAWTFDGEIGEDVMEKTPRTSSDHEIFDRERERDRERAATCRVVETWHPGNLAWAEWRGSDDEVLAAEMREAMRTRDLSVVVIALRCGDDERRQRRLATGRERLPSQEDENDDDAMFVETGRIGARAEAIAREELKREQLRVVWTDRRSVSEVVDEIQAHLLEMVLPEPKVAEVPELCVDLESALKVFKAAAKVLPELASRLAKVALPEPLAQQSYPGVTVTVDGLDGCGKSTLVKRLRRVLGSSAIHARSPPRRLDDLRRFVETAVEGHKNPYFQNSEAVARLSRSFYFLGNYALADDLLEVNDPAVVDRFASSTLAYTLGSADATQAAQYAWLVPGCFGEYVLPFFVVPVKGEWPRDLPTADVALVLDADESIRRERIDKRSAGKNVGVGYWERATFVDPFLGPAIARRFFNSAAACPEKKNRGGRRERRRRGGLQARRFGIGRPRRRRRLPRRRRRRRLRDDPGDSGPGPAQRVAQGGPRKPLQVEADEHGLSDVRGAPPSDGRHLPPERGHQREDQPRRRHPRPRDGAQRLARPGGHAPRLYLRRRRLRQPPPRRRPHLPTRLRRRRHAREAEARLHRRRPLRQRPRRLRPQKPPKPRRERSHHQAPVLPRPRPRGRRRLPQRQHDPRRLQGRRQARLTRPHHRLLAHLTHE
mmetsp:Transcript_37371/g.119886  ORF Transcript_37371/g.119886 Transcript_37371/m.119886 type:complete len:686 (-) Transcript_37371:386-2443(-)